MACIDWRSCSFALKMSVLTVIGSVLLAGCSTSDEPSTRLYPYYLDERAMGGKGVVYIYEPVSAPDHPIEYWHFRYSPGFKGNIFRATLYDDSGMTTQVVIERFANHRSELMELQLNFMSDEEVKTVNATINERPVFPFGPIDSALSVRSQFEYYDTSADTVRVILTRERTVAGTTEFLFEGKNTPAVEFSLYEMLETETEGFTETPWTGKEIYAQDVGLVYYRKDIAPDFILEYRLVRRVPFEQFITARGW